MQSEKAIKLFGLNNLAIEAEIQKIEGTLDVDLGHHDGNEYEVDQKYYLQFPERFRNEATKMARNYVIFYCLENTIREIITLRLEEQYGPKWWDDHVPDKVRSNAETNKKKELSSGVTPRSTDLIDFTNFGELGEIIKMNWEVFGEMFQDIKAVQKVLATLNALRSSLAHCKALAENEEMRLHLALRDWFRQME